MDMASYDTSFSSELTPMCWLLPRPLPHAMDLPQKSNIGLPRVGNGIVQRKKKTPTAYCQEIIVLGIGAQRSLANTIYLYDVAHTLGRFFWGGATVLTYFWLNDR